MNDADIQIKHFYNGPGKPGEFRVHLLTVSALLAVCLGCCVAGLWYAAQRAAGQKRMELVYDIIDKRPLTSEGTNMTEAEVNGLLGWAGQATGGPDNTVRIKGGGLHQSDDVFKEWQSYGTVLWVRFNNKGRVNAVYITAPLPFALSDHLRTWAKWFFPQTARPSSLSVQ